MKKEAKTHIAMPAPHKAPVSSADDEPSTPYWLPSLGFVLFVLGGLGWAVTPPLASATPLPIPPPVSAAPAASTAPPIGAPPSETAAPPPALAPAPTAPPAASVVAPPPRGGRKSVPSILGAGTAPTHPAKKRP